MEVQADKDKEISSLKKEASSLEAELTKANHEKDELDKKNTQNAVKLNQLENAVTAKGNLEYWII